MYSPLLVLAYQWRAGESFADFCDGECVCSLSETCHFADLHCDRLAAEKAVESQQSRSGQLLKARVCLWSEL